MKNPRLSLIAPMACLALAACTDPTGPSVIEMLLQVRATQPPTGPTGQALAPGVDAIDIQEAVVVFGGLRLLAAEDETTTTDWTLDDSVVLPVRLSGDPTLAYSISVPEGRYRQLDVFLHRLENANPEEAALINVFPRLEEMSLLVRGTLTRDGVEESFLFKSPVSVESELVFDRPEQFTAAANAVKIFTLTFHLDEWFSTETGRFLDPNDEADRAEIDSSIVRSVELIKGS